MRTLARLPQNLSDNFSPRLDSVSLNVSASCSNGLLTVTWDDLAGPFADKSQSSGPRTYANFNGLNSYYVTLKILSGWSDGANALSITTLSSADKTVQNLTSISPQTYSTSATIYNNEVGINRTTSASWAGYGSSLVYDTTISNRSVEINISDLNVANTESVWKWEGPLVSGNAAIFLAINTVNRYRLFDPGSYTYVYRSSWGHTITNLSGPNIAAPVSAAAPTGYSISGRTISWSNSSTNSSYYLYVYKWNGSSWVALRNGYLADGDTGSIGTGTQSYTIPASDGSGSFYIAVSTYSRYSNSFSSYSSSSSYTL